MKIYNRFSCFCAYVLIAVCLCTMGLSSYAYFSFDLVNSNQSNFVKSNNKYLNIEYSDTSSVSFIYDGSNNTYTKEFTIYNNYSESMYYDIILNINANNFNNISYTLYSDDSININDKYLDSSEVYPYNIKLAGLVSIDSGKSHKYVLTIKINSENDGIFSANLGISVPDDIYNNSNIYNANSIGRYLIDNNENKISILDKKYENIADGLYFTNDSIDGTTIYFFRGSNKLNNNVVIGSTCYKVIRTTVDKGLRLIYSGTYVNNKCSNSSINPIDGAYNSENNSNSYVGLMYGSPRSTTYDSEHANTNTSYILSLLYDWYNKNDYLSNYIIDSIYCSDRSINLSETGYSNNNTNYNALYRTKNLKPTYNCINLGDRFNKENLIYQVSTLSIDEAIFAGYSNTENSDNYLNNGTSYWTITPGYFYSNKAYNYYINNGVIDSASVNTKLGIRPVITINGNSVVLSGNGSYSSPYIIK